MEFAQTQSRVIAAIFYDGGRQMLGIKKSRGGLRLYRNVPPQIYDSLRVHSSPGLRYEELRPLLGQPVSRLSPTWWTFRYRVWDLGVDLKSKPPALRNQ